MKFTCSGSIRGNCGIIHKSFIAATKCIDKEYNAINKLNFSGSLTRCYSDREIIGLDKEARNYIKELTGE